MINKLKSYPKQIDNMTRDPPHQTDHRDPKIPNWKDIRQYQSQRMKGPRECHTPVYTQADLSQSDRGRLATYLLVERSWVPNNAELVSRSDESVPKIQASDQR
jgi:hypothetical protein